MKIKRFTLLTLPVLVLIVGAFVLMSSKNSSYFPRKTALGAMSTSDQYLEYIRSIKANMTTGNVSTEEYFAAVKQADRMPKSKASLDISWSFLGPDNVGGRTRAIIVDKDNPNHIVAGAATGGVYESFDGAKSWEPYDLSFSISNISSITQAKDGSFFVGTGGHFESPDNKTDRDLFFIGSGLYKLTGDGNFKLVKGPSNTLDVAEDYSTIGKVVASPTDANKLYVAMNKGFRILEVNDDGDLVNESTPIAINAPCNDIEVSENGRVVVAFEGKIYVSESGDANFVETTPDLLYSSYPGFSYGRIEVAIAPTDDKIVYAAVTAKWGAVLPSNLPPVGNNCLAGIYRSQDGGLTWEIIRQGAPNVSDMYLPMDGLGCTGSWSNTLAVFPDNSGKIIVGGDALYRWEQSSVDPDVSNGSWTRIDFPLQFSASDDPYPNYLHSGKHNIVWDPENSDIAYIATNGGIAKTENFNDEEPTYKPMNYMYNTTQYYSIDVNSKGVVMAGSHDNGTHILNLKDNVGNPAYTVYGNNVAMGDHAFDCQLSSINPELGFASKSHNRVRRIQGIGTTPGSSNYSEADIYNNNGWLGGLCAGAGGCTPNFYTTSTFWESFDHEGSTDSVEFIVETLDLPPYTSGTEFTFEGNNNRYLQTGTIDSDIYPIDTVSGSSGKLDTFLLADGNTIIMNFDTIVINNSSKTIDIKRRGVSTPVSLSYEYGDELDYVNGLLGLSTVTTDSLISIVVDTFKTADNRGEVFVLVENAFINFRYILKFQDRVQSIFATANWPGRGGQQGIDRDQKNIFISRDLLKGVADVSWFMIGGAPSTPSSISGDILDMQFSSDGNHLFVATVDFIGGRVYRISDIDSVKTNLEPSENQNLEEIINTVLAGKCHEIGFFPTQAVTSIAVDPNNPDNVVVALGNYGGMSHISRTTIATTAMDNMTTFESISGSGSTALPRAPAYSVLIDKNDHNRVLIGTDLGVFGTDNAFSGSASSVKWTNESEGIGKIPVFDLVQMKHDYTKASNDGEIYAATHGRGAYVSDVFVGINKRSEADNKTKTSKNEIKIYPNPVSTHATVALNVVDANQALEVQVYNIKGQLVKTLKVGSLKTGENRVNLNLQDLNRGTYILRTVQSGNVSTAKFIKN